MQPCPNIVGSAGCESVMTNTMNATLFAAATVLLAVATFFFIEDWQPDFPFWGNTFAGQVSVGGFRFSYSWIANFTGLALCWAAFVVFCRPDE